MQIHYTQAAGITGHVMIFCMVIIYTFAHEKIRRQAFEAFQWGHRLYIVFLFASWTHGAGCFVRNTVEPYYITDPKNYWAHCVGYQSWRWETWFSVLYIIERLYAYFYYRRKVTVSTVLLHPSDVMEIRFDKAGMNYRAGQWIFLKCPRLANMEWHPFSISSCPYDAYMSVHIRQAGDFTSAFRGLFNDRVTPTPAYDIADFDPNMRAASVIQARAQTQEMPEIIVEGPYGSPAEDMFGNEVTVLIGAGIGVTPWASVLKSLWHLRDHKISKSGHRLRRVEFIWTCRDLTMFEWFQNLITSLNEQSLALKSSDKSIRVSCHTYITRPTDAEKSAYAMPQESTSYENPDAAYDQLRDASLERAAMESRQNNNIHLGRPNFKTIFRDIKQNIDISTDTSSLRGRLKGRDQIGVNFCGPKSMARDVRKACAEATTAGVKFKFTKEAF
jgi:NADPH oxidase